MYIIQFKFNKSNSLIYCYHTICIYTFYVQAVVRSYKQKPGEGTIDHLPRDKAICLFSTFAIFSNATRLGCQFAENILLWVTYLSVYNISTLKTC